MSFRRIHIFMLPISTQRDGRRGGSADLTMLRVTNADFCRLVKTKNMRACLVISPFKTHRYHAFKRCYYGNSFIRHIIASFGREAFQLFTFVSQIRHVFVMMIFLWSHCIVGKQKMNRRLRTWLAIGFNVWKLNNGNDKKGDIFSFCDQLWLFFRAWKFIIANPQQTLKTDWQLIRIRIDQVTQFRRWYES